MTSRTPSPPPTPEALAADVAWLPHRVVPASGQAQFVRLTREDHRRVTFLTDEYIGTEPPRVAQPIAAVVPAAAAAPRGRAQFIFHSAFCCSTLLARAVDVEGHAMGLKEPVALLDLAESLLATRDLPRLRAPLAATLDLLARPFGPGETVVVKPTNIVNALIEPILSLRPEAKALLLYSPLPDFLRSVARKGLFGRIWARRAYASLSRAPGFDPGYSAAERWEHTDLQVAALGWLQQQALFARLVRTQPARVRTLDTPSLLGDPAATMTALDALFGLGIPAETLGTIAAGPIFSRNSKRHAEPFDANRRAAEHEQAASAYGEEIDKVVAWAGAVAAHLGVPMTLAGGLLGQAPGAS